MIATTGQAPADSPAVDEPTRRRGGGPKTKEGRERSRANALKHGLRAKILLPEDLADAVDAHTAAFGDQLRPETPYQGWLVGQMALAAARLDRCAELGTADLLRVVERAEDCWDPDRCQAAEDLGARLHAEPARVGLALRRTRHGADWLIGRWDGLAHVARTLGAWDEPQRQLAFDLLGTPAELRNCSAKLPADADGPTLAALADGEAAALRRQRADYLDRHDERARELTAAGAPPQEDAESARLRRYESECRRSLRWALAEFRRTRPTPAPPRRAPSPAPAPAPAPAADRPRLDVQAILREVMAEVDAEAAPAPPAPAAPRLSPPPAPPQNRQARRAQERRARQAARAGR